MNCSGALVYVYNDSHGAKYSVFLLYQPILLHIAAWIQYQTVIKVMKGVSKPSAVHHNSGSQFRRHICRS